MTEAVVISSLKNRSARWTTQEVEKETHCVIDELNKKLGAKRSELEKYSKELAQEQK